MNNAIVCVSLMLSMFWLGIYVSVKDEAPIEAVKEIPKVVEAIPKESIVEVKPRIIKVMIIDTGIGDNPKLIPFVQYKKTPDYKDSSGHGTHVAGIVALGNHMTDDPLCPEVHIYSCKYWTPASLGNENLDNTVKCIRRAIREKMDYINYSGGGYLRSDKEFRAYREFTKNGGVVVVAAGNERENLEFSKYYPASYAFDRAPNGQFIPGLKNMIVVSAVDSKGVLIPMSNKHPKALKALGQDVFSTMPGGQFGYMTGTSQAAPAVLHTILKQKCNVKVSVQQPSN